MKLNKWINEPNEKSVSDQEISFKVLPKTDFWQVTHYRFSRTDGNCYVSEVDDNTEFKVKVKMNYIDEFDQVGIIVYQDKENFAKLCIENQLEKKNKLGSVVCKDKRSDWATQPCDDLEYIYLKVSKRDINYLFEYSFDGITYEQSRLFDLPKDNLVYIGVFGAAPLGHGFKAEFTEFEFGDNNWYLDMADIPDALR